MATLTPARRPWCPGFPRGLATSACGRCVWGGVSSHGAANPLKQSRFDLLPSALIQQTPELESDTSSGSVVEEPTAVEEGKGETPAPGAAAEALQRKVCACLHPRPLGC
jgi:hypothetical protein